MSGRTPCQRPLNQTLPLQEQNKRSPIAQLRRSVKKQSAWRFKMAFPCFRSRPCLIGWNSCCKRNPQPPFQLSRVSRIWHNRLPVRYPDRGNQLPLKKSHRPSLEGVALPCCQPHPTRMSCRSPFFAWATVALFRQTRVCCCGTS